MKININSITKYREKNECTSVFIHNKISGELLVSVVTGPKEDNGG